MKLTSWTKFHMFVGTFNNYSRRSDLCQESNSIIGKICDSLIAAKPVEGSNFPVCFIVPNVRAAGRKHG